MIKILREESGFTLLELLISIALIAVITAISLGGMKFSISAREIGDQRTETYQRLRFIGEQISGKIKSLEPLFILPFEATRTAISDKPVLEPKKVLALEGTETSLRFITFSDALSRSKRPPWIHEILFYLGEHPETREAGIIMMEREISFDDMFSQPDPSLPGTQYVTLAKDVSYLKFRYLKMRKLSLDELSAQEDKSVKYAGEWVDSIEFDSGDIFNQPASNQLQVKDKSITDSEEKFSVPRAIEVSLGLRTPPLPGKEEEPRLAYLPSTIIPLNAGMQFFKLPKEEEKNVSP